MFVYKTLVCLLVVSLFVSADIWKWKCSDNYCTRISSTKHSHDDTFRSLEECRLVCGPDGSLWPLPTIRFTKSNKLVDVDLGKFSYEIVASSNIKAVLLKNIDIFEGNVIAECGENCSNESENGIKVLLNVSSDDTTYNWSTNEGYVLKSNGNNYVITAETIFGARHGLETLSQLIAVYPGDSANGLVIVQDVDISDKPSYPHRGLLLDSARNFLPSDTIKRQIDGMAASKMNVLHWHIADSQSFPYVSERVPNLAKYGAYSEQDVYDHETMVDLISYATLRGVRILLEIDSPAHAGNGWQWGPSANLGDLAVCVNQQPWRKLCIQPPCGQLNPANEHVYEVLGNLYNDIIDQLPANEAFHMGGDEVYLACWNSSDEIIRYLQTKKKGRSTADFLDLWGEFHAKALRAFDSKAGHSNTAIVLWSSMLTDPENIRKYLDKNRYVIETWVPSTDPLPNNLLKLGYKLIISTKNAWYLDHGFWGTTTYYDWRTVYSNVLIKNNNVLGGEVCMWGEYIDDEVIDGRIWPRAAAAAERLWTNPSTPVAAATPRMYRHRERLVARGIDCETLSPRWCFQNEGECL